MTIEIPLIRIASKSEFKAVSHQAIRPALLFRCHAEVNNKTDDDVVWLPSVGGTSRMAGMIEAAMDVGKRP